MFICVHFIVWNTKKKKGEELEGTLSVKFGIYLHQMTIFRGVLDNCPTYFYHPIII
jgi:hypothetical protein